MKTKPATKKRMPEITIKGLPPRATNHILWVDVLEAVTTKTQRGRIRKVSCFYQSGDLIYGTNAYTMPHPDLHISAHKQHTVTWWASRPFEIRFKNDVSDIFSGSVTWKSVAHHNGVHEVVSRPVKPGIFGPNSKVGDLIIFGPRRRKRIEVEFRVIATKPNTQHVPDPTIQPLDPHIIIEP